MIIIGELINGTRPRVAAAIASRDAEFIANLARKQAQAGADYIDCNSGRVGVAEAEDLAWLVQTVEAAADRAVSLDSANPEAIAAALQVCRGAPPLINSVMADEGQLAAVLPMVVAAGASVIALTLDHAAAAPAPARRVQIAQDLVQRITAAGISPERIFVDPVVAPLSTSAEAPRLACETMRLMRRELPDCHIVCGLSNVSHGLPARALLNRTFLAQAIMSGLDAAILDPLDRDLMRTIRAAEALAGRDEWCLKYIQAHRDGLLDNPHVSHQRG